MTPIDAYRPINGLESTDPMRPESGSSSKPEKGGAPSFQSVLGDLVREVNGLQQDADRSIEGLITGETTNIHDVTTRMTEAGIAFDLMMEVRNKLLDAYQQIARMQA